VDSIVTRRRGIMSRRRLQQGLGRVGKSLFRLLKRHGEPCKSATAPRKHRFERRWPYRRRDRNCRRVVEGGNRPVGAKWEWRGTKLWFARCTFSGILGDFNFFSASPFAHLLRQPLQRCSVPRAGVLTRDGWGMYSYRHFTWHATYSVVDMIETSQRHVILAISFHSGFEHGQSLQENHASWNFLARMAREIPGDLLLVCNTRAN
jgi:hypothetical protein